MFFLVISSKPSCGLSVNGNPPPLSKDPGKPMCEATAAKLVVDGKLPPYPDDGPDEVIANAWTSSTAFTTRQ